MTTIARSIPTRLCEGIVRDLKADSLLFAYFLSGGDNAIARIFNGPDTVFSSSIITPQINVTEGDSGDYRFGMQGASDWMIPISVMYFDAMKPEPFASGSPTITPRDVRLQIAKTIIFGSGSSNGVVIDPDNGAVLLTQSIDSIQWRKQPARKDAILHELIINYKTRVNKTLARV